MLSTRDALLVGIAVLVSDCTPAPSSGNGFTLPDGDRDAGGVAFVELKYHRCHTIAGGEIFPDLDQRQMNVRLGGAVARIGPYGELVTAIINPSHRLAKGQNPERVTDEGESVMKNYNNVLTVTQLIDLVAFLRSRYVLRTYERTTYPMYY